LRLLAAVARRDSRLQDQVSPVHGSRSGVLRRQPQADPKGGRRRDFRGRLTDRAARSEPRKRREPPDQSGRARLLARENPVRDPVQQARLAQRRRGRRAAPAVEPDERARLRGECPRRHRGVRHPESGQQAGADRTEEGRLSPPTWSDYPGRTTLSDSERLARVLDEAALKYLERFDASIAKLRTVLLRKGRTFAPEGTSRDELESVVHQLVARYQRSGI